MLPQSGLLLIAIIVLFWEQRVPLINIKTNSVTLQHSTGYVLSGQNFRLFIVVKESVRLFVSPKII